MAVRFEEPSLLFLLFLIPVILYFYRRYSKTKKQKAMKFSSVGIIKESIRPKTRIAARIRLHLPFALILSSAILIIIGLSNPMIPLKSAKEGVNVVLVIDDSGSMAATDYKPTRLEAAKNAAEILIKSLKDKDNVGIVLFESGATTTAYLTPFKGKAIQKLKGIEQKPGRTAIGDGLGLAVDMATSIPNKKKAVILLSDGVSNAGVISPDEALAFARSNKIQVTAIALGSEKPVVLGYDFFGNPQYAETDENALKLIAEKTGGSFYKSVNEKTLDEIYKKIGENIEREWEDTSIAKWFFETALVVLIACLYVVYGRYMIVI